MRDLTNLVESLELEVREPDLSDTELFLFTYTTSAKAAYWKGHSQSETLFDLVLWLRLLEVKSDLIIHIIHVAGTRTKGQGMDGISPMRVMQGIPLWAE